ncbi:MAG: flagellar assembly protein T N-terminal domain-containing protein [Pseudomonadota bacterium]
MNPRWRRLALAAAGCLLSGAALALNIVAEGEAPIINDDLTLARQSALRRAMAAAVEQGGGVLRTTTVATPAGIEEKTTLTGQGRVLGVQVLSEHIDRKRLRLTAEVRIGEPGVPAACAGRPLRKTLVTTFPLRYPEQIRSGEYMGWPQIAAEDLARLLNQRGRLLAAVTNRFPFPSVDAAPEVERAQGKPLLTHWAERERAQYVVAGVFRDFGVANRVLVVPERQMVIEAFIYDGISGELLARQEFARQVLLSWQMPKSVTPGTRAFAESRLGQAYYGLLGDVGAWAENTVGCLPFSGRVIRADGKRLHIDVGSDSGIEPGMEFVLARPAGEPATSPAGELLGDERVAVAGVVVTSVQPRHSVVEIAAKKNPPPARVGDVIYGR